MQSNKLFPQDPLIVIGAQKCGTTTLLHDLSHCNDFYTNINHKEASPLLYGGWRDRSGRRAHQWLTSCPNDKTPVDISTRYSMCGSVTVPVDKIVQAFPQSKIIYMVRHPIERALSHHRHNTVLGLTKEPAEKAIHLASEYTQNSLYGTQLSQWIDHFTPDQIMIVKFESYVLDRRKTILGICDFAGVPSTGVEKIDIDNRYNVTAERQRYNPLAARLQRSYIYRQWIKNVLGSNFRNALKNVSQVTNDVPQSKLTNTFKSLLIDVFDADNRYFRYLHPGAPQWEWD